MVVSFHARSKPQYFSLYEVEHREYLEPSESENRLKLPRKLPRRRRRRREGRPSDWQRRLGLGSRD